MSFKISKLQVNNFRNLSGDPITLSNGLNCIFGNNGNGKTNILEAIYYLSMKKSFRKKTGFPQLLSVDCEKPELIISSVLINEEENINAYSMKQDQSSCAFFLDSKAAKKRVKVPTVFINPVDSQLFHTTPSVRRDWFNTYFSQLDEGYKKTLKEYSDCLKFRNSLLNNKPYKFREQIRANDPIYIQKSLELVSYRKNLLKEINPLLGSNFGHIFDDQHELQLQYETHTNPLQDILAENFEKDCVIGHTSYGVHKDDYMLLFDGMNAYEFCSLGQQKMSYLSLLFAYIELFRYKFRAYPIVLIDDVSGELDSIRWKKLIQYFAEQNYQVILTTANEKFRDELTGLSNVKNFVVESGVTRTLN